MGRDLNWYVIPRDIEHDPNKRICLNWEFQKDEDEVNSEIYEKVVGSDGEFELKRRDSETITEFFKRKQAHNDVVLKVVHDYVWSDDHKDEWCPKCDMFAKGLYESPLIVSDMHIGHSYSNQYWWSKWNIKDLYMGSSQTPFVNLFRNENTYREIEHEEVERAIEQMNELGTPLRTSDIEACDETMEVLEWLKIWTADEKYIVIMDDEI